MALANGMLTAIPTGVIAVYCGSINYRNRVGVFSQVDSYSIIPTKVGGDEEKANILERLQYLY